jgi:hypothetical protein
MEIVQRSMEAQKSALSHYRPKVEIGYPSTQALTYAIVARKDIRGTTVIHNARFTVFMYGHLPNSNADA